jgi:dihydrofolate synthase/folylpolyglutamate synthase
MTYPEAISHLGSARRFGMKLGLEPMQRIAARLGDPQAHLRFIHLAGSNGKGSTAAFCESCLRAGGHRVGLYTSPHLVSIRERIQVGRQPISEATFFELMTGLALWHFARERVDWVVWETGLGGRLDATNIVRPAVSVITTISLEHTEYLGTRLEEIAREKAGIIKEGTPVVSGVGEGRAREVIATECARRNAPLHEVRHEVSVQNLGLRDGRQMATLDGKTCELGLIGGHQLRNAACAVAALRLLPSAVRPDADAVARGLASASWAGRFQIVSQSPLTVLDGAHNLAAMETLVETWCDLLASRNLAGAHAHLLFAAVMDKDISGLARLLLPHAARVSLVRLQNDRSADPADLVRHFPGVPCEVLDSAAGFRPDGSMPVLVTGSLFLVGEMLAQGDGAPNHLRLNERLERPPASP